MRGAAQRSAAGLPEGGSEPLRGARTRCQASAGKEFPSKLQSQLAWLRAPRATALSDTTGQEHKRRLQKLVVPG